eukprot:TRINITY_DN257_c0_g1_i2.p1 TRINITY_DN257_c0_g1~~TRINITY_DN257_c0_g1_i2.p1  ORF type:complete len:325 (-),score=42.46 TRINITY_DN257_c0_g1_i2:532-1506(-)
MSTLLRSIAPKFCRLQSLNLRQIQHHQLNDEAVEAVAKYCHDLHSLDLSNSNQLTDASLETLAHGCNQLEKLYISGCSGITDSALINLATKCKKLIYLNLCGCVRAATDRALQALAQNCHDLQSLNLGWCEKVTDVGVTSLAKGCPQLRAVDLCGCVLITDQSVIALAQNCPLLKSLGLYYCQNITDKAMYSLVNSSICGAHRGYSKQSRVDRLSHDGEHQVQQCRQSNGGKSRDYMESVLSEEDGHGLLQLNISQCTSLSAPAVQAVCDTFPGLHTCSERHSLIISGCLNLTSVHCVCGAVAARRGRKNRSAVSPLETLHAIR